MPRNRTLYVSALNIALHRHGPQIYVDLLGFIKDKKIRARFHGDRHAIIGYFDRPEGQEETSAEIKGQILTFVEIDPNEPWLNFETGKRAEDDDLDGMSVPDHLKPGMRIYNFVLFTRKHRIVFESRTAEGHSLGPANARRIFEVLLKNPEVIEQFGPCEVTIEPTEDALENILSIKRLEFLELHFTRPNPDDNEDDAEEIRRRMDEQNADTYKQQLSAPKGESLSPDDQTRRHARVAASNGYVNGRGKDAANDPVNESTRAHPLRKRAEFNPETQTAFDALLTKAREIMRAIGR